MIRFFLRLIFPSFCVGCFRPGPLLCPQCDKKIKVYTVQKCLYCERSSFLGFTHPSCIKKGGVDGVFSFFYYRKPLIQVIKEIKYRRNKSACSSLISRTPTEFVFNFLDLGVLLKEAVITYVPQSLTEYKSRGFNQSEILAKWAAGLWKKNPTKLIQKLKVIPKQSQLPYYKRPTNVRNAFSIKRTVSTPATVVLVDDVVTTGSTVKEISLLLKKSGVKKVFVVSFLRAR